jgi:hypothetical protein
MDIGLLQFLVRIIVWYSLCISHSWILKYILCTWAMTSNLMGHIKTTSKEKEYNELFRNLTFTHTTQFPLFTASRRMLSIELHGA